MMAKKKWIKDAVKRPGAFTAKAKAAGHGVQEHARAVLKKGSGASTRTKRQASFAKAAQSIARKRKKR